MRTHAAIFALSSLLLATAAPMARAEKVDTGVEAATPVGIVLRGTVLKDGAVVSGHSFGRDGSPVLFPNMEACEAFKQMPYFPAVKAQLDAFAAAHFPGSTTAVSCEKPSQ